jgi:hypothetical protein
LYKNGGDLGLLVYPGAAYLIAKTNPTPDVEDDDDEHYTALLQIPPPKAKR